MYGWNMWQKMAITQWISSLYCIKIDGLDTLYQDAHARLLHSDIEENQFKDDH